MKNIRGIFNETTELDVDSIVWNSILSLDRPEPDRYTKMAEQIIRSLNAGRETHLIAHSFGSAELVRALLECQKLDKRFPQRDLQKLHISLVSPSGMFAGVDGFMKFMRNDVPELIHSVSADTPYRIVDGLMCFPPQGLEQSDILTILQQLYPSHTQVNLQKMQSDFEELPELHDYSSTIKPTDVVALQSIDKKISQLYHKVKPDVLQYCGIKELLKERTHLLEPYLHCVYEGDCYESITGSQKEESFHPGLFAVSLFHFLPALWEKFLGRFPDMFREVQGQGASMEIFIPTHDAFVPFERVAKLFPEEKITFIPGTHMTFPTQPRSVLLTAMNEHRENR